MIAQSTAGVTTTMSFFEELKRRNVVRMAVLYVVACWLILQVADVLFDALELPPAWVRLVLAVLVLGFPITLIVSWVYEMTPEGLRREKDVERSESVTRETGRKINTLIVVLLVLAIAAVAVDRFMPETVTTAETPAIDGTEETATFEPTTAVAGKSAPERSVAVLPFVAMSSGPDDEYFADGMTEEILNSLSQLPELLVTARTSAFSFKGQDVPIPEIAAKLGVAHVVEGSVRRAGEQLRITAQLIRAGDGFHLWSDTYDRSSEDSFGVQAEIAEKVAAALDVVLDEKRLGKMRSVGLRNPEAFIAFQKGQELYYLSHGSQGQLALLDEANVWFDRTLALAPALSQAYVLHSDKYAHLLIDASNGKAIPKEELTAAIGQMESDFNNAIRYAPDEAQRLAAAFDLALLTGRWRGLTSMVDEVVKLQSCWQPGWMDMSTLAYGMAGEYLTTQQTTVSCDPLTYSGWYNSVQSYIWLGEHRKAIEIGREGLETTSHNLVRRGLIYAYISAGEFDQAEIMIDRGSLNVQDAAYLRARIAAAMGDATKTKTLINDYIGTGFAEADDLLVMRAIAGDRDQANELAAEIDARPYGFLSLMNVPSECFCGAPFDLTVTPNFAMLLEEADLPWPPASPIEWPLKDW
jgi:TolB-like protein